MTSPVFDLLPGESLVIYEGDGSWVAPGSVAKGCRIRVEFSWAAGTLVHFDFCGQEASLGWKSDSGVLMLRGSEVSNLVMLDDTTAALNPCVIGDVDADIDTVIFHVCNFVPYLQLGEGRSRPLTFEHGGWIIELEQVSDARDRIRDVRRLGGGAVTHVGAIRDASGSSYAWAAVQEILDGFGQFLNWAASDRVPILLPVGIRGEERLVEAWGDPRRQLGRSGMRWFSAHDPETLSSMWPRFASMWSDREWRAALTVAGELYADSHHGAPLEIRIVTAWAALEIMAWQWLTRIENLDAGKVDSENADWRIRRMLKSMQVPIGIRPSMAALTDFANGRDGPKTVADLRNRVVHPKEGVDILDISSETKQQAWNLALWYMELALMKLCQWDGPYLDRTRSPPLWEGNVSYPPWNQSTNIERDPAGTEGS